MKTKHVFRDLSTIAELWATQAQEEARNPSGNFWFKGTKIYSYRTILGELLKRGKQSLIVLNKTPYSKLGMKMSLSSHTTSRHQAIVDQSTNNPKIACPDRLLQYSCDSLTGACMRLVCWQREFANLVVFLAQEKPGSKRAERRLMQLEALRSDMIAYAKFMGYSLNKWRLLLVKWED